MQDPVDRLLHESFKLTCIKTPSCAEVLVHIRMAETLPGVESCNTCVPLNKTHLFFGSVKIQVLFQG